ncbi:MAG TPA: DUF4412 domain-containing protein [Anaeromyxobacteraceae bacterium]|nr:DUF4412 domain-containing protein [Anaeromyxobacteraceae bacterium]
MDGKKKQYYIITEQDMQAMAVRMQKMESKMGDDPPIDYRKLGTTRKIAGYSCGEWMITVGKFSKSRECLTTELQSHAWDAYKEYFESTQTGPMAKVMAQMWEKSEMKGYPMATTTSASITGMGLSSNTLNTSQEVTDIKRGPIPVSVWAIPADYTRMENPAKAIQRARALRSKPK